MKKVFFCVIIFLCFNPGWLLAGETVTAKGLSFFEPGREVIAREKALDEAKRGAIEKAMGTTIESRTTVENFEVVKDQIFSRSSGYLKNIKVLSEKKTEFGTYEVEIQAEVETAVLIDDIDRFQNIIRGQKNPRVRVIIDPDLGKEYLPAAKKAANLLTSRLKQSGFKVFTNTSGRDAQMGLLVGVSLELSSRKSSYQGLELLINEVGLTSNISRPEDGEILATASAVHSMPGESKLQIMDEGSKACVNTIWKELRQKLIRLWEKELYSEREISLNIKALTSHARAHEIADIFKHDVSGVLDASLISFRKNMAEYSLKYRGWPDQFLNEIQMSYFQNRYFVPELESIAGNKIVIKIR
ncbi:hypothetical protein ACFL9U_12420 [Thermodesulfobacteriota bacterium]